MLAILHDAAHIMRHHQYRRASLPDLLHAPVAFCLKEDISHRERLIDDQYIRLDIDSQRKCQPHKHTRRVGLDRLVHEIAYIRKVKYIRQPPVHLLPLKAHHRTVHVDILYAGIVGIEACSQLQQRGDSALRMHLARCRTEHTGDDLEDGRLA